ncbi:ribosome silencing factor [Limosilactobacillus panis]|uniref:ribosome silencing factor n=1 Tax=Limosilactobacillus panis TaxID=47493 RepID=UPI00064981BD|nr:ribosome silencing factor [Limosilactobacillus panis]
MERKQLLEMVVKAADGRRAEDITTLQVDQISPMADYFVIMTGGSDRQVQAIANAIIEKAHENQVEIGSVEGKNHAKWVLIDLGDVVVHVFREETRHFYNLEKLWSEAPLVNLDKWIKD